MNAAEKMYAGEPVNAKEIAEVMKVREQLVHTAIVELAEKDYSIREKAGSETPVYTSQETVAITRTMVTLMDKALTRAYAEHGERRPGMNRLNNYLVAALELLDNKELKGEALMREVYRARRIYELALQIIDNNAVMFDAHDDFDDSLTGKLLAALKILVAKREMEITNRWQTR